MTNESIPTPLPSRPTVRVVLQRYPIDEFVLNAGEVDAILSVIGDMPVEEVATCKPHELSMCLHKAVQELRTEAMDRSEAIKKDPTKFRSPIDLSRAGINAGIMLAHLNASLKSDAALSASTD